MVHKAQHITSQGGPTGHLAEQCSSGSMINEAHQHPPSAQSSEEDGREACIWPLTRPWLLPSVSDFSRQLMPFHHSAPSVPFCPTSV